MCVFFCHLVQKNIPEDLVKKKIKGEKIVLKLFIKKKNFFFLVPAVAAKIVDHSTSAKIYYFSRASA